MNVEERAIEHAITTRQIKIAYQKFIEYIKGQRGNDNNVKNLEKLLNMCSTKASLPLNALDPKNIENVKTSSSDVFKEFTFHSSVVFDPTGNRRKLNTNG